jgi:hypothetical protein
VEGEPKEIHDLHMASSFLNLNLSGLNHAPQQQREAIAAHPFMRRLDRKTVTERLAQIEQLFHATLEVERIGGRIF